MPRRRGKPAPNPVESSCPRRAPFQSRRPTDRGGLHWLNRKGAAGTTTGTRAGDEAGRREAARREARGGNERSGARRSARIWPVTSGRSPSEDGGCLYRPRRRSRNCFRPGGRAMTGLSTVSTPLVYDELRRLAHARMRHAQPGHTLQTTALANEAYLRLVDARGVVWQDRAHFFAICARLMRHILVDAARARGAQKTGGGAPFVAFDERLAVSPARDPDLLALDEALDAVVRRRPAAGRRCVELRYFGGLSVEETAEVLGVSPQTVMRDWKLAKLWLVQGPEARRRDQHGGGAVTADRRQRIEAVALEALARDAASARRISTRRARTMRSCGGRWSRCSRGQGEAAATCSSRRRGRRPRASRPPPLAPGHAARAARDRGGDRRGRDGRGLQGSGHAPGPDRRHQGAAAGAGGRPGAPPPVRARGPRRLGAESSAHLPAVRPRRSRPSRIPNPESRVPEPIHYLVLAHLEGQTLAAATAEGPAAGGAGAGAGRADGGRAERGAQGGDRAPRPASPRT
ncbi:MAG: ECF-type sigma factor [Sphingobacterium sp.]|nr:ECF-type sigma factor [Sphingobacterium sp.]